jgi:hypothetical protein
MSESGKTRSRNKPGISGVPDELDERLTYIEARLDKLNEAMYRSAMPTNGTPHSWLSNLLQGVTLLSIIGFAFWLGSMSNKISDSSAKIDKLYSVVLESRDSISSRLSGIEAKLDGIDNKLSIQRQTAGSK